MFEPTPLSNDYVLGAFDCAMYVCDALRRKTDPDDLMNELIGVIARFNDERVFNFMERMSVRIEVRKEGIEREEVLAR